MGYYRWPLTQPSLDRCANRLRNERQWPSKETGSWAHCGLALGAGIARSCGHTEEGDLTGEWRGAASLWGQEGVLFSPPFSVYSFALPPDLFLWVQPFDVDHTTASTLGGETYAQRLAGERDQQKDP